MSETQSLEEAHKALWEAIAEGNWGDVEHVEDAVRALLLVGLEEARAIDEAPTMARAGLYEKQQRRIEELGR